KIQRIVPRPNPDVNRWWMCDRGRSNFAWYNDGRVTEAAAGGRELPLRDVLDALVERLAAAPDLAVLLSPKLANEELLVWRRLSAEVGPARVLGAGSLEPPQPEDAILRRADAHPNAFAVRALGLEADPRAIVRDSGARALFIVGDDPVGWDPSLAAA